MHHQDINQGTSFSSNEKKKRHRFILLLFKFFKNHIENNKYRVFHLPDLPGHDFEHLPSKLLKFFKLIFFCLSKFSTICL